MGTILSKFWSWLEFFPSFRFFFVRPQVEFMQAHPKAPCSLLAKVLGIGFQIRRCG
jgi:hypothetical protein